MNATANNVEISLSVSDAMCADILCTALEGGIGYWALADEIQRGKPDSHGIEPYLSVELTDAEEQEDWKHTVDYAAIRLGISRVLDPDFAVNSAIRSDVYEGIAQNDAGMIDADAADVIVQAACFGELVYG